MPLCNINEFVHTNTHHTHTHTQYTKRVEKIIITKIIVNKKKMYEVMVPFITILHYFSLYTLSYRIFLIATKFIIFLPLKSSALNNSNQNQIYIT